MHDCTQLGLLQGSNWVSSVRYYSDSRISWSRIGNFGVCVFWNAQPTTVGISGVPYKRWRNHVTDRLSWVSFWNSILSAHKGWACWSPVPFSRLSSLYGTEAGTHTHFSGTLSAISAIAFNIFLAPQWITNCLILMWSQPHRFMCTLGNKQGHSTQKKKKRLKQLISRFVSGFNDYWWYQRYFSLWPVLPTLSVAVLLYAMLPGGPYVTPRKMLLASCASCMRGSVYWRGGHSAVTRSRCYSSACSASGDPMGSWEPGLRLPSAACEDLPMEKRRLLKIPEVCAPARCSTGRLPIGRSTRSGWRASTSPVSTTSHGWWRHWKEQKSTSSCSEFPGLVLRYTSVKFCRDNDAL